MKAGKRLSKLKQEVLKYFPSLEFLDMYSGLEKQMREMSFLKGCTVSEGQD